jgi:hypothetical protein
MVAERAGPPLRFVDVAHGEKRHGAATSECGPATPGSETSAAHALRYYGWKKSDAAVASTRSDERSKLKADSPAPRVGAALFVNRRRHARRALRRPLAWSIEQWPQAT